MISFGIVELVKLLSKKGSSGNAKIFVRIVNLLLEERIMSEASMADASLTSRSSVGRWAKGRNLPGRAVRKSLCQYFADVVTIRLRYP